MSEPRDVRGIVLCGGRGSRLRPLSYYIPKPMVPIGRCERPLLEYILRLMAHHGVREVLLLIGYKGEQVRNYFRDGRFLGINLTYLNDDPRLPGTGGAVLNALRRGLLPEDHTYLIYYGDILSDIDLVVYGTRALRAAREALQGLYGAGERFKNEFGPGWSCRKRSWPWRNITSPIISSVTISLSRRVAAALANDAVNSPAGAPVRSTPPSALPGR